MDFELGLKLTKVADEFDLLISKDQVDPVFMTQQTDSMFVLTSHLKGYKRRDIYIEINEDGSRITISGERPVQETLMVKGEVVKKETKMKGFRKTFKIPDGVVLDKVKARFSEDESRLTIRMPKAVEGIMGIGIEELKDEDIPRELHESSQFQAKGETLEQEKDEDHKTKKVQKINQEIVGSSDSRQEEHVQDFTESTQNVTKDECKSPDTNKFKPKNEIQSKRSKTEEFGHEKDKSKLEQAKKIGEDNDIQEAKSPQRSSMICAPIIAGSTLFVSLIVVVLSLIRSKNESSKKRN